MCLWVVAAGRRGNVAAGVGLPARLSRCLGKGFKASSGVVHLPTGDDLCRVICRLLRHEPIGRPVSRKGARVRLPSPHTSRLPGKGPIRCFGCVDGESATILVGTVGAVLGTRTRRCFSRGGRIGKVSCVRSTCTFLLGCNVRRLAPRTLLGSCRH